MLSMYGAQTGFPTTPASDCECTGTSWRNSQPGAGDRGGCLSCHRTGTVPSTRHARYVAAPPLGVAPAHGTQRDRRDACAGVQQYAVSFLSDWPE